MNALIDFDTWPRNTKGRIPESEEALRCDKLAYFEMELALDRPLLSSDCGSDVFVGAEKHCLRDWNRCTCHFLNIRMQVALKSLAMQKFVGLLEELARKFSRNSSLWKEFERNQLEILHRAGESSDYKGEDDFDEDEGLSYYVEGKWQVENVLRLLTLELTRWNSMYYMINRELMIRWLGPLGRVWAPAIMPLHYFVLSMVVSWVCTLMHYILRLKCAY